MGTGTAVASEGEKTESESSATEANESDSRDELGEETIVMTVQESRQQRVGVWNARKNRRESLAAIRYDFERCCGTCVRMTEVKQYTNKQIATDSKSHERERERKRERRRVSISKPIPHRHSPLLLLPLLLLFSLPSTILNIPPLHPLFHSNLFHRFLPFPPRNLNGNRS